MIGILNSFIFIFGLFIGSFLNCIVYRLEKKQSFLKGRSYCPHCKHNLCWEDLIPVLSFLILKGKCRYCRKEISIQYPLVEISTGLIFLLIFSMAYPVGMTSIYLSYLLIIASFLILIFVFDLKHFIIPDKVLFPAIAIVFLYRIFLLIIEKWNLAGNYGLQIESSNFINYLGSAIGGSAIFLAIYLFSKGKWMGFGDVKLVFFMGLFLGYPNILVALFFAFTIGAIIGIGLILLGKKKLKSEIPFGPFLIGGTFVALFWGQQIINWYLNLILF